MNLINATITDIKKYQNISTLSFDASGLKLSMVALEIDESLQVGTKVNLKAKATNIALAKDINSQLSISNQLKSTVQEITRGEILCSVKLKLAESTLESIITQSSAIAMNIQVGDEIIALIKASDISIAPQYKE
jgi:molybdopterin-binding protein